MIEPLNWIPFGDDGSVELLADDGEYIGAFIRNGRVILGGNNLWTTYILIRRKRRLKLNKRQPPQWTCETAHHDYRRPQFIKREDAIAWCEKRWRECYVSFPPSPANSSPAATPSNF